MDKRYLIQEIKNRIDMLDILRKYGLEPKRGNRIPCPLHRGKDANFSFKDGRFKCFVCGESGDVISFVEKYYKVSFAEALEIINRDFNLGLPIGEKTTLRKARYFEQQAKEAEKKANEERKEKELLYREAERAFEKWKSLDEATRDLRPKNEGEGFDDAFVDAIKNISKAEFELEEAETRIYLHEHR